MTNSQAFLEADIAVAEREEQGDRRFQLLGSPIADADSSDTLIVGGEEVTPFTVVFDGVLVDVISQGTPPDLFEAGVPVVLEGQWVAGRRAHRSLRRRCQRRLVLRRRPGARQTRQRLPRRSSRRRRVPRSGRVGEPIGSACTAPDVPAPEANVSEENT